MEVSAQINKGDNAGKSATVNVPSLDAEDLKTLVENFGEQEVYDHARRSFVVSLQSNIRAQIDAGKSDQEIQEAALEWRPGRTRVTRSPQERISEMLGKMSPAEREALLAQFGVGGQQAA